MMCVLRQKLSDLLPPSPPAEKATARQVQAGEVRHRRPDREIETTSLGACQRYQDGRQAQNCHCDKYHSVDWHVRQKLGHLRASANAQKKPRNWDRLPPCPKNDGWSEGNL